MPELRLDQDQIGLIKRELQILYPFGPHRSMNYAMTMLLRGRFIGHSYEDAECGCFHFWIGYRPRAWRDENVHRASGMATEIAKLLFGQHRETYTPIERMLMDNDVVEGTYPAFSDEEPEQQAMLEFYLLCYDYCTPRFQELHPLSEEQRAHKALLDAIPPAVLTCETFLLR